MSENQNDRTSSPSSYETLSDQFDGKMLDFSLKILAFLAVLVLRPLANTTAPLFRKNMGIRYFTMVQLVFGLVLWGLVVRNSSTFTSPIMQHCYTKNWYRSAEFLEKHKVPSKAVNFVCGLYGFLAMSNIVMALRREKKGQPWHTQSRGESWFGNDNFWLEWGVSAVVCAAVYMFSMPAGALFFVSRAIGLFMHLKEQRMALNQYYDRVDAKIEHTFLNVEIATPKPISETMGFRLLLPPHIKGEQRVNIAKVLGGQLNPLDETTMRGIPNPTQSPMQSPNEPTQRATYPIAEKPLNPQKKSPRVLLVISLVAVSALALAGIALRRPTKTTAPTPIIAPYQAVENQVKPTVAEPPPPPPLEAVVVPTPSVKATVALAPVLPAPDLNQLNISNYSRILLLVRSNTISAISTNKAIWTRQIENSAIEIKSLGYFSRRKFQPRLDTCVVHLKQLLDAHRDFIAYLDGQLQLNSTRTQFSNEEYEGAKNELRPRDIALAHDRNVFDALMRQLRVDLQPKSSSSLIYDPNR